MSNVELHKEKVKANLKKASDKRRGTHNTKEHNEKISGGLKSYWGEK